MIVEEANASPLARVLFALKTRRVAVLAGAASLMLFASSAAQAQCRFTGFNPDGPGGAVFDFMVATAGTINATIATTNTAFLTQTSAFLASPQGTQPNQFAGGVWMRGVGGEVTLNSSSSGTQLRLNDGATGTTSCSSQSRSSFGGVQVGIDSGRLDFGNSGWNVHLGFTAGYLAAETRQSDINAKVDVPFLGVYAAAIYGNFFIEAQIRGDFYQIDMSAPSVSVSGLSFNAYGLGISTSAGYNLPIGDFFLEPSIGLIFSRTTPNAIAFAPAVPGGAGGTATFRANLNMETVETLLGRAGARIGTTFVAGGLSVQPFLAASVWHDFADDAVAKFTSARDGGTTLTGDFGTTGVGTYGQYSVGFAATLPNTPWLGYARFDYRNGDNIDGWSINAGIRYQFAP